MSLRPFAFGRNLSAAVSVLLLLGALSFLLTGAATPVAYGAPPIASQSSALATGCAATSLAVASSAGTGWPKQTEATLSAALSPSAGCGGLTVTWTTIQNNTGADYGWYCGIDWPTACASNKGVASTTSMTGDGTAGTTLGVAAIGYNTGVKCVTLIAAISSPTLRGTLEPGWDYPASNYVTGSLCAGETGSKLLFTTQPGGAAAGSAFLPQPAVSVEDTIGNVVLNSTASIMFGIASGGGTLSGCSSNPVIATNGVAALASCTIGTASTYTLNATSSGLTSATSSSFTMTARLNQTINFTGLGSGSVGGSATMSATGGASGNPVVFTVDGSGTLGACNVSGTNGTTVNYTAVGNCVIDANQAGNSTYNVAPQVQRTITLGARTDSISFGAGFGSGSVPSSQSGADGTTITLPSGSGLADSGHTFAGWSDGTTTFAAGSSYTLSGSLTLIAQWTINSTDTISFSAGTGSGSVPSVQSGADGTTITLPPGSSLADPGHNFVGWSDGTTTFAAGATYTLAGSLTLTAQWTANRTDTITFSAGGGSGSAPSSQSGADGTTITLPSGLGLSYSGHTFAGWSDATTIFAAGATYTLSGSLTLTAQWTANSTDTITFSAGGGSGSAPSSQSGADGTTITLPAGSGLSYLGRTFAGWSDGTTTFAASATYTLSGSLTLTAQWTANRTDTISFSAGAGSGDAPSSISGPDGSSITLPDGSALSNPGRTFAGWSDGTTTFAAGATYTLTGSLTLTAQWTRNSANTFTITFNTEGGTSVAPIRARSGSTVTLPAGATRVGYIFLEWFTSPTGGSRVGSSYQLLRSVTLYARWQRASEVPTGSGEITSSGAKVTKVAISASHGEVVIGTDSYGLKIKTGGTSTTFAKATITLVRGSNVTLSGYGFMPGTIVRTYVFSNPTLIGVARVGRNGTYSGSYLVPSGLTDGPHSIESLGTIYNGTLKGVAAPVWVTSRTTSIVIDPFDFNSATLTPRLKAEVAKAARIIREYRVRSLTFTGYTDPRGSTSLNLALSRRRVSSVAPYLLSELHAVHYLLKNVQLLGLGKTHLVFAADGTVKNGASRRVVITLRT